MAEGEACDGRCRKRGGNVDEIGEIAKDGAALNIAEYYWAQIRGGL